MTQNDRDAPENDGGLDALSQVMGGFAHDFSNVLATIILNLNLIQNRSSDPTLLSLSGSALRAADRGADLANRLLAFVGKQRPSRPRVETGAADISAVRPGTEQSGKAMVLVVDDDVDLLSVAAEGLADLGYEVLLAHSGLVALEILASDRTIDLLMVDASMAGMNGLELIRHAREMRPGMNALITTGGGELPEWRGGGPEPAVLAKPFRVVALAEAVAAAMASSKAP